MRGYVQFNKYTHIHTHTKMGMGTRMGTGTGTTIGSGRAEERRRSAINRKIVVHAMIMGETGETWVERGKNVEKKELVQ